MAELLIVDDDSDVCWILEQILEAHGYSVRVAHDGEEGLASLQERLPEVIVLDVEMPLLDGPSMAYRIFVHDAGFEDVPVVLVSGCRDLPAIAQRVGTPYYLGKPFEKAVLLGLIERALTEHIVPRPPS